MSVLLENAQFQTYPYSLGIGHLLAIGLGPKLVLEDELETLRDPSRPSGAPPDPHETLGRPPRTLNSGDIS